MARTHEVDVSNEVNGILRRCSVSSRSDGTHVIALPSEQLPRPTYEAVDKILKGLGGKWKRGTGHVFKADPRSALVGAVSNGKIVDMKKTLQAFFTPSAVADSLVAAAQEYREGRFVRVLEPSAGGGAIIDAVRRREPQAQITAVDIHKEFTEALLEHGAATFVRCANFLDLDSHDLGVFDVVIMNPPFTAGQDIEHVIHAWGMVEPAGVLAAIVSKAFMFRDERRFSHFRELHDVFGVYEKTLPTGTFKESGTNVETVMIVWHKKEV